MTISTRFVALALALQLSAACGDAITTTPLKGGAAPPVSSPTVLSLSITPGDTELALGAGVALAAAQVRTDGTRLPVNAHWASSSDQVVTVNGANGYAVAIGPGTAVIRADIGGLIAYANIVVRPVNGAGTPESLVIESFTVIEFQYPSAPGHWFYAPQLRVLAAPGRTITVLSLNFTIPGLDAAPPFGCGAVLHDTARELNGEVYGDWAFTIDETGHQASGAAATATISFVDEKGATATRVVTGPIVRGALPSTYGGAPGGCFHGYGSTG